MHVAMKGSKSQGPCSKCRDFDWPSHHCSLLFKAISSSCNPSPRFAMRRRSILSRQRKVANAGSNSCRLIHAERQSSKNTQLIRIASAFIPDFSPFFSKGASLKHHRDPRSILFGLPLPSSSAFRLQIQTNTHLHQFSSPHFVQG